MAISNSQKIVSVLITSFLLLVFIFPEFCLSIGQITSPIVIKNVLRGQNVQETLNLLNSEQEPIIYELKASGEIAVWTSFYTIEDKDLTNSITQIQVPSESYLDVIANFQMPEDAPNGDYTGQVVIMTIPEKTEETEEIGTSVRLSVSRKVLINVSDEEIIDFETTVIPKKYGVKTNEPLRIKIIYENKGNIAIKPDIQLTISKEQNTIFNAIFPYPEDEPVRPRTRKIIEFIEWQTAGQENGKYRAEVKALLNRQVYHEGDFSFYIGYQENALLSFVANIGQGNLTKGWLTLGFLFLILAGILITLNKDQKLLKRLRAISLKTFKGGRPAESLKNIQPDKEDKPLF